MAKHGFVANEGVEVQLCPCYTDKFPVRVGTNSYYLIATDYVWGKRSGQSNLLTLPE
jgi:hypothetical protein